MNFHKELKEIALKKIWHMCFMGKVIVNPDAPVGPEEHQDFDSDILELQRKRYNDRYFKLYSLICDVFKDELSKEMKTYENDLIERTLNRNDKTEIDEYLKYCMESVNANEFNRLSFNSQRMISMIKGFNLDKTIKLIELIGKCL